MKYSSITFLWLIILSVLLMFECQVEKEKQLFTLLSPSSTNITFSNSIVESPDLNILNFHYIYNGGGVGIGDFNQDGLEDIIFTGNQVQSEIYLNQGDLTFKNITTESEFISKGWDTGVSIIDINNDGLQDIYLSRGGQNCPTNCNNKLFINQGNKDNGVPKFKDLASEYGLEDPLYTQQALFFDFDLDGDLDVYLLHNHIDKRDKNAVSNMSFIDEKSKDKLLQNDNGKFIDVSAESGIDKIGYGLGIAVDDFNQDSYLDIYIANDYMTNDLLWINKGFTDGKHNGFADLSNSLLKHTSYNAMGVDVGDLSQDALADILVLDMLPETNERKKSMLGFMNYDKFLMGQRQGYKAQVVKNTLQINNGMLEHDLLPFSEVANFSKLSSTDWSWSPLIADFDNDKLNDIFVTNGYGKDITDLDFVNFMQTMDAFGTTKSQENRLYKAVNDMKSVKMDNYIFKNNGDLSFSNKQNSWMSKGKTISNGSAYADLDNDGDLELIVNNIDQQAFVYQNNSSNNTATIDLYSSDKTRSTIGSKITIWIEGTKQTKLFSPVRSYLSSMTSRIHFGLGNSIKIDSLEVIVPTKNGKATLKQYDLSANKIVKIDVSRCLHLTAKVELRSTYVTKLPNQNILEHKENNSIDYYKQPLMMHQLSMMGPSIAAANIDGKIGDELFIGGSKGNPSRIVTSNGDTYVLSQILENQNSEDLDAIFIDLDNDNDLDLYVVTGSYEFGPKSELLSDRIYINQGDGVLNLKRQANLPKGAGSVVKKCDFNKDGRMDLFVGSRVNPSEYPRSPFSFLLTNDPRDQEYFKTYEFELGMVSDAIWSDFNNDSWMDLIVVGEWNDINIIVNKKGVLDFKGRIKIPHSTGLWTNIEAYDFDQDGDEDFVVTNQGENSILRAAENGKIYIYQGDYDSNKSVDPLIGQLCLNQQGEKKIYPLHNRDDITKQLPVIKKRYLKYSDFGKITFQDLLEESLNSENFLKVELTKTSYIENLGDSSFKIISLPKEAQFSKNQDILIEDINQDGHADILLIGNDYTCEKNNGWLDASLGTILLGNSKGQFKAIPTSETGFFVESDARRIIKAISSHNQELIIIGQNNSPSTIFAFTSRKAQINEN